MVVWTKRNDGLDLGLQVEKGKKAGGFWADLGGRNDWTPNVGLPPWGQCCPPPGVKWEQWEAHK